MWVEVEWREERGEGCRKGDMSIVGKGDLGWVGMVGRGRGGVEESVGWSGIGSKFVRFLVSMGESGR